MNDSATRVFLPVSDHRAALPWLLGGLTAVIALVAWMGFSILMPPRIIYEVDSEKVVIRTSTGLRHEAKEIQLGRIYDVSPTLLRGRERRMGDEKPGYCVGLFYYGSLGEAYLASNCSEQTVVIRASGEVGPVVITPPDRDEFVKAVREPRRLTVEAPSNSKGRVPVVLGLLVTLLGLGGGLVVALWLAPRRLRYQVHDGQLFIHTLAHRMVFPVAGTKVRVHRPLMGHRLSGIYLPGYWIGSWVLDDLATSVFGSVKDEGVLVEADGRLFLTPQDRKGLVAALIAAGATEVSGKLQRRL